VGFDEIFTAVSAAMSLHGGGGLPENPRMWGSLFVGISSVITVAKMHKACIDCACRALGKYPDPKVHDRVLAVCQEICRLAAEMASGARRAVLNLPGPSWE
jgi:hypothetical protein